MAYTRLSDNKTKGEGLDIFVDNIMKLYDRQLSIRNAEDEDNFNRLIVDGNLTLDEQLSYRKEQLKRVSDDSSERKRIRTEIRDLNQRVEQQKFSEEYLSKVAEISSGITSIDSVISWLEDQLASATDSNVRTAIGTALAQKNEEKFKLTQTILENQTKYALQDKTESIINTQISRITEAKNKALLSGDQASASSYDLQIQALTKALNENSISKDIKNFAVSTVTGYASAVSLLDSYNNKISSSSPVGSVTIGDITYASPQEFWRFKRDSYVADQSESGFFSRFSSEKDTQIKVKNSQNILSTQDIKNISSDYDALLNRPELANYQFSVTSYKQNSIQTGVNLLANKITNNFSTDYNLNTATAELNSLKSLGGNVDDAFTKIITDAAALKNSQVASLVQNAQQLLLDNPNMSVEEAVNSALGKGSAALLSPNQLLTQGPATIAKESITAGQEGKFNQEERTTTPASDLPVTTPQPIVPEPSKVNQTSVAPAATNPTPVTKFIKQLDFGINDPQVKELQKFLNSQGYKVSESGAGSPGYETDYFGPLTQKALQQFQSAQGIVSTGDPTSTGYGRLGPQTISAINKLLGV